MPLLIVVLGVALLFVLIVVFKLDAFISFFITCLVVGIGGGLEPTAVIQSIQTGIGYILGFLVIILGLGAMLGKLVADSGAAQRITTKLVDSFGIKYVQWAVMLAGFIVGIPMFYSVGFVILIPLVFTVAAATGLPLIYVGLPMLASLSVTHGFLPPHPAPTAIAQMFEADMGQTLVYGIIIGIPAIVVAGPILTRRMKHIEAKPLEGFYNPVVLKDDEMPSFGVSFFTGLLPVILIAISSIALSVLPEDFAFRHIVEFIGNPAIAMLLSVLFAIYTLGLAQGKTMAQVRDSLAEGITGITMVLLVIAGAGALKQVLIDTGVSDYIGEMMKGSSVSPLILAWLTATAIRVCVGSATIAGMTAAGIMLPLIATTGANPELMVIAIGAGSIMLSHVNDSGFWLFKEYFNLSVKDTLSTWTVMETTLGVMGLIGVLILDLFV